MQAFVASTGLNVRSDFNVQLKMHNKVIVVF